jgi:hypothetical protein
MCDPDEPVTFHRTGTNAGLTAILAKSSLDHATVKPAIFRPLSRSMHLARIILAFVIALSVAMLPAAAGTGVAVKSAEMSDMPAMDHDCCPPKADPCANCTSMAACALKCFGFSDTAYSIVAFPSIPASLDPPFESNSFRSQIGSPPFRPPRV